MQFTSSSAPPPKLSLLAFLVPSLSFTLPTVVFFPLARTMATFPSSSCSASFVVSFERVDVEGDAARDRIEEEEEEGRIVRFLNEETGEAPSIFR